MCFAENFNNKIARKSYAEPFRLKTAKEKSMRPALIHPALKQLQTLSLFELLRCALWFAFPVIISDVIERKYDVSDTNPPESDPKIDPTFRAAERHQPEKNTLS